VCYYKNHYTQPSAKAVKSYYTLTFAVQFEHKDDTCYFAACYPYTATQLKVFHKIELSQFCKKYLNGIEESESFKDKVRRTLLCYTNLGNTCDLLTITSFPVSEEALKVFPPKDHVSNNN
jgi:hypothetical protein